MAVQRRYGAGMAGFTQKGRTWQDQGEALLLN